MILTTHSVIGAASAYSLTQSPLIAFCVGFFSHFILDSIPHWEYYYSIKINNLKINDKEFLKDFLKISADLLVAFLLVFLFIQRGFTFDPIIWLGALGAVLPDVLQFLGGEKRLVPFHFFRKLHDFTHSRIDFLSEKSFGFLFQLFLVLIFLSLV